MPGLVLDGSTPVRIRAFLCRTLGSVQRLSRRTHSSHRSCSLSPPCSFQLTRLPRGNSPPSGFPDRGQRRRPILGDEAHRRTENCEEILVAKTAFKNPAKSLIF